MSAWIALRSSSLLTSRDWFFGLLRLDCCRNDFGVHHGAKKSPDRRTAQ